MGAPGKAFVVSFSANEAVGRSSASSVRFIREGFGTSTGVNARLAVPTRNPAGSAACVSSQARCASAEANTREVLGMGPSLPEGRRLRQTRSRSAGGAALDGQRAESDSVCEAAHAASVLGDSCPCSSIAAT